MKVFLDNMVYFTVSVAVYYLFQKRHILEINNELEPRLSALVDDDIEDMESSEEEGEFKVSCVQLKVVSSEWKFIKGVTIKPLGF